MQAASQKMPAAVRALRKTSEQVDLQESKTDFI